MHIIKDGEREICGSGAGQRAQAQDKEKRHTATVLSFKTRIFE